MKKILNTIKNILKSVRKYTVLALGIVGSFASCAIVVAVSTTVASPVLVVALQFIAVCLFLYSFNNAVETVLSYLK